MGVKKLFVFLGISVLAGDVGAGLGGLTHHSRANCAGFNETISWDFAIPHEVWVVGRHRHGATGQDHQLISGWQTNTRVAVLHFPEGSGGWTVEGHHWMRNWKGQPIEVASEFISDCSLYDGW